MGPPGTRASSGRLSLCFFATRVPDAAALCAPYPERLLFTRSRTLTP